MDSILTKLTRAVLLSLVALFFVGAMAYGQLMTENFGYSTGQLTAVNGGANVSGGNWTSYSGTTLTLQVASGSLSYSNYGASGVGNMLNIQNGSAEDAYRAFTTQTTGTIYSSFLLRVDSTTSLSANSSTTGDYFAGYLPSTSTTALVGRISTRQGTVGGTWQIGLRAASSNATAVWNTTDLSAGTTYLVILGWKVVTGSANDTAKVWINPTIGPSEPTPDLTQVSGTDNADFARFFIRQGTNTVDGSVDGIRVGTSWSDILASASSDIISTISFVTPTNIAYGSHTGSDVTSSNPEVYEIDIRDGGGAADADALSTTLTALSFSVTNSSILERVALYDGTTELAEVAAGATVTFSGLTVAASDDGSKTLNLRATYKTVVTDNTQFSFTVTSATAQAGGSSFATSNAGGAASSTAGDDNRIEVTATKFNFSTQPPTSTTINTNFAAAVNALDALDNVDLDATMAVTLAASAGTLSSTTGLVQNLVGGSYSWTDLQNDTPGSGVTTSATGSLTTAVSNATTFFAVEPTVQASSVNFSNVTTASMDVNWTNGNGATRIVVARQGSAVSFTPTDGSSYSANSDFSLATDLGSGNKVVYSGTGSTFSLSGLAQNTTYHVEVFEFNGASGGENYLAPGATGSQTTTALVSVVSDIVDGGNTTSNVAYASYQAASIAATTDGVRLWSFTIRDGGGSPDGDSYGTELHTIVINKGGSNSVANWANTLRRAALFDGSTLIQEVAVTGESITFTGMSGANVTASDDGSKTLDLYVTFETGVVDNEQFHFTTDNSVCLTGPSNTSFFGTFTATSSVTGDANRVEVTATNLQFSTQPPASVDINTDFTAEVTAKDANGVTDLDYAGNVTVGVQTGTGTLSAVSTLTHAATAGEASWSDLRYDTPETGVVLNASDGSLTNGLSSSMNVTVPTSTGSDLVAVASSETGAISSVENDPSPLASGDGDQVWQISVRDGGGVSDADLLPTEILSLVLHAGTNNEVPNWSNAILAVDLFDGATHLASGVVTSNTITFSGFSASAPDNGSKTLSMRMSLKNPLGVGIADMQNFEFSFGSTDVTTASAATSSQLTSFSGVNSDEAENQITVTATQLVFTTQPTNNQLTNANIAPVAVTARDANGNTDLDYATAVTLSSGTFTLASTDVGGLSQTPSSGVASWTNLSSSTSGLGTVLANSGILTQGTSSTITVLGAVVTSVASGNWNAGATWDQGVKPTALQTAVIAGGHTVTVTATDSCAAVTVQTGGTLDLSTFTLQLAGTFTLQSGANASLNNFNPIPGNGPTPYAFDLNSTFTIGGAATGFSLRNPSVQTVTFGQLNWASSGNATPPAGVTVAGNLVKSNTGELRCGTGSSTSRTVTVLGDVTVDGGTLVASNSTAPVTGAIDIGGNLTINAAGTLRGVNFSGSGTVKIGGSLINNGGKIKVGDGAGDTGDFIVYFKGTGAGTIAPGDSSAFRTVAIAPGRSMSLTDTMTINATYTMTDSGSLDLGIYPIAGGGSFTLLNGATLGIGSPAGIAAAAATGNVLVSGTRTFGTLANYLYNGSSAQITGDGLPASVNNLTVNNASGVTLSGPVTVNGTLALTNGAVTTGASTLTVWYSAAVTRTSGHVNGNLDKAVIVLGGAGSQTWEIGDGTNYTPVTISGSSFTNDFNVTASTSVGDHASIGSSIIIPGKSVNRTYSLNGTYGGPYDATFTFVPGDVDGGANTANFGVGKFNSPNWTYPTVGTRTATSTQITGVTSFSDFQIGELTTYTITVTQTANGTIAPGTTTLVSGTSQAFTVTPDPGYIIDSIFVDGAYAGNTSPVNFNNVSANHTLTATYMPAAFTITVTPPVNGSITPGTTNVPNGGTQAFIIAPATGYHIDSVLVDGAKVDSTTSYTFVNVQAAHTIAAFFSINTYTLTVNTVGSGSVAKIPNSASYDHGTPVTLTPTPATGWLFSAWSGDATGNANPLFITMTGNATITATFTEDPAYLAEFRSFAPESLAVDKDNKGKIGKYVKRKADKVDFVFTMVAPAETTSLKLKFSMATNGVMLAGSDTLTSWTAVKEVITTVNVDSGDTITIIGRGDKGKPVKTTFDWSTTPTHTKGTVASYSFNQPRLPMPNRVNALLETFLQGGFSPTLGLLVGKDRTLDSAKQYGWLLSEKYTDVLKSLYVAKTSTQHTGQPRGFDTFVTLKPLVKRQKSLPPTKHNNALLAEMIAVKFNIAASALEKTPIGFGELVYDDGTANMLNGMMVKEIAAYGDSIMMGYYSFGVHTFTDSAEFGNLYATVSAINNAFEGPVDTIDFATKLHMKGVKTLLEVPYLRIGTEAPMKIVPVDVPMYEAPVAYKLDQNYPNPFNPTTTISFDLPQASLVTLKVFNLLGQEIATLVNNEELEDGTQEFTFDASMFSTGVYFYRLTAQAVADEDGVSAGETFTSVKKMMLVK